MTTETTATVDPFAEMNRLRDKALADLAKATKDIDRKTEQLVVEQAQIDDRFWKMQEATNLTQQEIAEKLDVSVSMVQARIRRAKEAAGIEPKTRNPKTKPNVDPMPSPKDIGK